MAGYNDFTAAMEQDLAATKRGNQSNIHEERVEVNQRALIDKILARYATAGAVYRELLQNSNDANATASEIYFTLEDGENIVRSVSYRNNGMPFRPQDWSRLKKIAEGNPDESKIGAFGVGAYSMFSICEQPIVVSGTQALAFVWKGDALWTRTMDRDQVEKPVDGKPMDTTWTTFMMPSRDPYPLPNLQEFGEFLCSSLTFTKNLNEISVYVNQQCRLHIRKTLIDPPRPIQIPKSAQTTKNSETTSSSSSSLLSSIWGLAASATTASLKMGDKSTTIMKSQPNGLFSLKAPTQCAASEQAIAAADPTASATAVNESFLESKYHFQVTLDEQSASMLVRYIVAVVSTHIPAQLEKRMERVTKKKPPSKLQIQMVFSGQQSDVNDKDDSSGDSTKKWKRSNKAQRIVHSVSPPIGAGKIFIGFKTSQTTGLAAHLAAPFVPTVEREAMDLQDPALRQFNLELLELSGRCMRLVLEHGMMMIGLEYIANEDKRIRWQKNYLLEMEERKRKATADKRIKALKADGENSAKGDKDNADYAIEGDDDDSSIISSTTSISTSSKVMWGFAKFMAKGVKKQIVKVLDTVGEIVENASGNETTELLNPHDPFPLCMEEQEAVALMQAFLPQQSTPDPTIGATLAQGFVNCLPDQAPPVLTKSGGVVPGTVGKLPNHGMEAFCPSGSIVRNIVYQNAKDYHTVIAQCSPVSLSIVRTHMTSEVLTEDQFIRFCKWWVAYSRLSSSPHHELQQYSFQFKDCIKFEMRDAGNNDAMTVHQLSNYLFYWDPAIINPASTSTVSKDLMLPMPEALLPKQIQDGITVKLLADHHLSDWLAEPLPVPIWMEYISHHPSMTSGKAEYTEMRKMILATIHQEYTRRRSSTEQRIFGEYCANLFRDKRCLPFDTAKSNATTANGEEDITADMPTNLYLASAELKAFSEIDADHFRKVDAKYISQGVLSEQFCVALGVRESVSIDFLFSNLETLRWSTNPRPLVEYLRSASYSKQDLTKLQTSSYLPCENDPSRMFAPHELYIAKNKAYRHLAETGVVRLLQWPDDELTEASPNGKFLVDELGMQTLPPLLDVLHCVANMIQDPAIKISCLDFVASELKPHSGAYTTMYTKRMSKSQLAALKIMPCTVQNSLDSKTEDGLFYSPIHCCASQQCGIMGFPILDESKLGADRVSLFSSRFGIVQDPSPLACIQQFQNLVKKAKAKLLNASPDDGAAMQKHVLEVFGSVFSYLSSRCSDMNASMLSRLHDDAFIPVENTSATPNRLDWYRHEQVFFKSSSKDDNDGGSGNSGALGVHSSLFPTVAFSPFLAAAGVKHEASTKDLFRLILESPERVLELGEDKYRLILRRIAADPPFTRVTKQMQQTPFLLAYTTDDASGASEEKKNDQQSDDVDDANNKAIATARFQLAKAEDIYIVDNSFFGRMFAVKQAPHESDLEEFYAKMGSRYISKEVQKRFDVIGESRLEKTRLILTLKKCLEERAPLLVSPRITSRPLVDKAGTVLNTDTHLKICEAKSLKAIFTLGKSVRTKATTCCSLPVRGLGSKNKNILYVTKNFDWFDVGYAIGELILKRCQLEDAFFISSLLDAPLDQLRARGFPVDRIIQPKLVEKVPPKEAKKDTMKKVGALTPTHTSTTPAGDATSYDNNNPKGTDGRSVANGHLPNSAGGNAMHPQNGGKSDPESGKTSQQQQQQQQQTSNGTDSNHDDYFRVLMQMFPDADEAYVRKRLGPNPTMDDLRVIADIMATGEYPRQNEGKSEGDNKDNMNKNHEVEDDDSSVKSASSKVLGSKKLGRAFGGLRRSGFGGIRNPMGGMAAGGHRGDNDNANGSRFADQGNGTATAGPTRGPEKPVHQTQSSSSNPGAFHSPQADASSHSNMEKMLQNTIGQSNRVNQSGINSPEVHAAIPEGLDRGNACEVVPGQHLKPFTSMNANGHTHNSIRVFSAKLHPSSEDFLRSNFDAVESFAVVLERLSRVYDLPLQSVAIFHDPTGGTIAFNANRALHFNVRFFHSLHYTQGKHQAQDCYSYWYIVMAHELAHHMVSGHNKEHGFYTESYAALFLPKLVALFASL